MPDKPDRQPSHYNTADPEKHIKRLVKEFEKRLREEMPKGEETLEEIERKAQKIGRRIQEKIQEEFLETKGSGFVGQKTPCCCGAKARFVACYPRQIITLAGVVSLRRAYYYCRSCRGGFCPLDAALCLGDEACSTQVRALLCRFASFLSFRQAAREMEVICGIRLSKSLLHRQAQTVGKALEQEWKEREQRLWQQQIPVPLCRPAQLHLSMDGVLIFVEGEWKEVKCGVAYETSKTGGVKRADYCASLSPSSLFGRRMRTLAYACGTATCRKVGMLADGAEWIWQETGKYFAHSTQILDFYHACEHLWEVARACFGEDRDAADAWMKEQKERLLCDQVSEVREAVEQWKPVTAEQSEIQRKVSGYLRVQAHRMCYQSFARAGWHIGSGVMEAACKAVVQARMKGAGMRWSRPGAEAMLQLRSAWCSSQHTDFTAAARRAATLS